MDLNINDVQKELDSIRYPANYYYDISTLTPKGRLAKRIEKLKIGAPELFEKTDSYLDIGCSLGYFLFHHKKIGTKYVCGTDMDAKQLAVTRKIKEIKRYDDIRIDESKFNDFSDHRQYDLIYLGNIFHYLYRDYTWDIVYKIAGLSKKYVVLELPLTWQYLIEFGWGDNEITRGFHEETFFKAFNKFFDVVRISDSFCHTRKIVVLKKKVNLYENEIDISSIQLNKIEFKLNNAKSQFNIFIDHEKNIKYKILRNKNTFKLSIPAYIMTLTESTPDFVFHIKRNGNYIGYGMNYIEGKNYPEKKEIFEKILKISSCAASCGIVFWDLGRQNFIVINCGKTMHFDIDEYSWLSEILDAPKYNIQGFLTVKKHYDWFIKSTIKSNVQCPIPDCMNYSTFADDFIENIGNRSWFTLLLEKYKKNIKEGENEL